VNISLSAHVFSSFVSRCTSAVTMTFLKSRVVFVYFCDWVEVKA
jgi:hypothetical protein